MSEGKETRLYEVGFLLTPQFTEAEISAEVEKVKKAITSNGGVVSTEGIPEFIDLSYVMEKVIGSSRSKYRQAYFSWVKFEATPEAMEGLKMTLDGLAEVIRYILLKTDAGNSVVFKKLKESPRREELVSEVVEEIETLGDVEEHEKLPELTEDINTEQVVIAEEKEQ